MKTPFFLFFILFFISKTSFAFVVLIDPGHGGEELGAITKIQLTNSKGVKYDKQIYEKDLALELALQLKKILEKKYSAYLTRSVDRTVSLENRANLADTVKADIFISIHFNSSTENHSHGFETYYLDNHKDKAVKKVEAIENQSLNGESKVINQILIDLAIQKTVPRSKKLATSIHKNVGKFVKKKFKVRDRGTKPGLFYVLALSKRPGVLIEAGFLSNSKEASKLMSKDYLKTYAQSIAKGIVDYEKSLPRRDIPLF